jgi:hypothetical protein
MHAPSTVVPNPKDSAFNPAMQLRGITTAYAITTVGTTNETKGR